MKLYKALAALIVGLVSTSAHAAAVYWEPVDGDVNYTYTTVAGYTLGMFDVDDFDGAQANPLMLNTTASADTIDILALGPHYQAKSSVTGNEITLFDDTQFVLAITDGINWFEEVSHFETAAGSNIYEITFANGLVTSIDAVPTVVPVPAAAWLFGSGLLGLVGIARRKALA